MLDYVKIVVPLVARMVHLLDVGLVPLKRLKEQRKGQSDSGKSESLTTYVFTVERLVITTRSTVQSAETRSMMLTKSFLPTKERILRHKGYAKNAEKSGIIKATIAVCTL
jgi:hypothetical protein